MSEQITSLELSAPLQRAQVLGWIYENRQVVANIGPVITIFFEGEPMVGAASREVTSRIASVVVGGNGAGTRINLVLRDGTEVSEREFIGHCSEIWFPDHSEVQLDSVDSHLVETILGHYQEFRHSR